MMLQNFSYASELTSILVRNHGEIPMGPISPKVGPESRKAHKKLKLFAIWAILLYRQLVVTFTPITAIEEEEEGGGEGTAAITVTERV